MATPNNTAAILGFEDKLWTTADQMDPSEYKHVVLGLVLLKYIFDAFQELYDLLSYETTPILKGYVG